MATSQPVTFTNNFLLLNPVSGFTAYRDCAVDMNEDQLDDVVRVGSKGLYIDYQRPNGSFIQKFFPVITQYKPNWSICAGDLDNNGYTDLLFGDYERISFLKADKTGSSFSESVMPTPIFCQRSTMADIDNDGFLDAFICNDIGKSIPCRNDGMGNMTPDTNLVNTADRRGNYAAIWTDYDNDGDIDLYITKCVLGSGPTDIDRINLLYQNQGNGEYFEVGAQAGLDDIAQSWSTAFEDYDNDGDMDAFIINHDFKNRLFRNNGDGTFSDVIVGSGIDPNALIAFEYGSGDFNNDGFMDIFSDLNKELYLGHGDFTFTGSDAPVTPGAVADFNNDGFLDVLSNGNIWLNNGNTVNHWLKVFTFGIKSNRNGVGAKVEIYGPWGIQIREVRSGQSYSPMSTMAIHFGLGTNESVDSLKIKWPSGIVTVLQNLQADTAYQVYEVPCLLPNVAVLQDSIGLCVGDTLLLEAPAGYAQYLWSNGNTSQSIQVWEGGRFFAFLTGGEGCVARSNDAHVFLFPEKPPGISASPSRRVCQGENIVLTASPGQNQVWSNGVAGTQIMVTASGNYTVSVDAVCTTGQLTSLPFSVDILAELPPTAMDATIGPGDSIVLSAVGANCHWYDQAMGGNLLHIGQSFQTPALAGNTAYYVESRSFYPGVVQSGGKPDTTGSGGLSLQTGFMFFEAWEPFTLVSVKVYLPPGALNGTRFVQLFSTDTLLAFKPFQIVTGWNTLTLNYAVPVGLFSLHCPLGGLFRNTGPLQYPYPIGNAGQITGSSFGQDNYYYFYGWVIKTLSIECSSERVPVNVTVSGTIEDLLEQSIEIFPNPAANEFNISFPPALKTGGLLRLFDINGRQVLAQELLETSITRIKTAGLAKGVYWLQIQQEQQLMNRKISIL